MEPGWSWPVVGEPAAPAPRAGVRPLAGAEEDHARPGQGRVAPELVADGVAVRQREPGVQEDQGRAQRPGQPRLAVARRRHLVARPRQVPGQPPQHVRLVVHQQDRAAPDRGLLPPHRLRPVNRHLSLAPRQPRYDPGIAG
jgi:hypothetical protein